MNKIRLRESELVNLIEKIIRESDLKEDIVGYVEPEPCAGQECENNCTNIGTGDCYCDNGKCKAITSKTKKGPRIKATGKALGGGCHCVGKVCVGGGMCWGGEAGCEDCPREPYPSKLKKTN
tara:strand:+ start:2747 stop:3112 length:366 start_codon:yes stop_codon:yes gene_type:complete